MAYKCLGVDTHMDINSPIASWKPSLLPSLQRFGHKNGLQFSRVSRVIPVFTFFVSVLCTGSSGLRNLASKTEENGEIIEGEVEYD